MGRPVDVVVTVCDSAREECPVLLGAALTLHRTFFDPGTVQGAEEDKLEAFRRVPDELRDWVVRTFGPGGLVERRLDERVGGPRTR